MHMLWWRLKALISLALVCVVAVPPAAAAGGDYDKRVALLIGLGKYQAGKGKGVFRDIPEVKKDLIALAKALEHVGYDEIVIYSDYQADEATKWEFQPLTPPKSRRPVAAADLNDQVSERLSALRNESGRTLFLVYFTGHGGTIHKTERVIATPDSHNGNASSFVMVRQLLHKMAAQVRDDAGNVRSIDRVLIVDACANLLETPEKEPSDGFSSTLSEEYLPVYFFSSEKEKPSFVDAGKGSVFTQYLARALSEPATHFLRTSDGDIDPVALRDYLIRVVPQHTVGATKREDKIVPQKAFRPFVSGRQDFFLGRERDLLAPRPNLTSEAQAAHLRGQLRANYPKDQ